MNANEKKIISCEMDTQKAPREHYTQSCEDNAKPWWRQTVNEPIVEKRPNILIPQSTQYIHSNITVNLYVCITQPIHWEHTYLLWLPFMFIALYVETDKQRFVVRFLLHTPNNYSDSRMLVVNLIILLNVKIWDFCKNSRKWNTNRINILFLLDFNAIIELERNIETMRLSPKSFLKLPAKWIRYAQKRGIDWGPVNLNLLPRKFWKWSMKSNLSARNIHLNYQMQWKILYLGRSTVGWPKCVKIGTSHRSMEVEMHSLYSPTQSDSCSNKTPFLF